MYDLGRGTPLGTQSLPGRMARIRPDLDQAAVLDDVDRAAARTAERAESRYFSASVRDGLLAESCRATLAMRRSRRHVIAFRTEVRPSNNLSAPRFG